MVEEFSKETSLHGVKNAIRKNSTKKERSVLSYMIIHISQRSHTSMVALIFRLRVYTFNDADGIVWTHFLINEIKLTVGGTLFY